MINIDDRLIREVSPKIKPNALSVLLAIAIHLNQKTNRCFPSHERLMTLTGLGKNSVYDALNVLKKHKLLVCEQAVDSTSKKFGRRTFRLTTKFVSIFVTAQDADPLPENREPENREPENREPENRETYQINKGEQINKLEQINNNNESAAAAEKPLTLEDKKEKERITPGAGPGDSGGGAGLGWRPIDFDSELARMQNDQSVQENFRMRCKLPLEVFASYISDFTLHVKSHQKTYSNTTELRSHFFNYCDRHKAKQPSNTSTTIPALRRAGQD